jgi:hypothetical protein
MLWQEYFKLMLQIVIKFEQVIRSEENLKKCYLLCVLWLTDDNLREVEFRKKVKICLSPSQMFSLSDIHHFGEAALPKRFV